MSTPVATTAELQKTHIEGNSQAGVRHNLCNGLSMGKLTRNPNDSDCRSCQVEWGIKRPSWVGEKGS